MCIRTTVSVRRNIAQKLQQKNNSQCISAIKRAIRKNIIFRRGGPVRYQSSGEEYCRIHITLSNELYEILCGIRWSGKVSVSLIISEALEQILSEKDDKTNGKLDSYPIFFVEFVETECEIIKTIRQTVNGKP